MSLGTVETVNYPKLHLKTNKKINLTLTTNNYGQTEKNETVSEN